MEKTDGIVDASYILRELKRVKTENKLLKDELARYKDILNGLKRLLEEK